MKKFLPLIACVLCVSMLLSACGPKSPAKKEYADYEKTEYLNDDGAAISAVKVGYDAELGENAELLNAAAEVMVFESGLPIALKLTLSSDADEEREYSVTDYFGNTLYSGSIACRAGQTVFTKGIAVHPTGHFTLTVGDEEVSYVITPPLSERSEDSPFAARLYLNTRSPSADDLAAIRRYASAAKLMGITWIRTGVTWAEYEPERGEYKFDITEEAYRLIDSLGLKLMVSIESPTPDSWTVGDGYPSSEGYNAGLRDTHKDIYNTAKAMASYYNGVVDAWEMLPNSDSKYIAAETAAMYSTWYKSAALGIADSGADALKMFGGFTQADGNYDRLAIESGVYLYSDVYNIIYGSLYRGRFINVLGSGNRVYHKTLAALGGANGLPMWNTGYSLAFEYGVGEGPGEEERAFLTEHTVTAAVQSLAGGIERIFTSALSSDGSYYTPDGRPNPAVAAEAVMSYMLDGASYVGVLSGIPSTGYGYCFEKNGTSLSVVWATRDKQYSFASQTAVTVTDVMGVSRVVEPVGGVVTLDIGTDPQYITHSEAPAYLAHSLPKADISNKTSFSVGERVVVTALFDFPKMDPVASDGLKLTEEVTEFTVRITNYNSVAVTGSVIGSLEGFEVSSVDSITVEPMGETTVKLTLRNLGGGTDGFLTVSGVFNGEKTAANAWHVYTGIHGRGYLLPVLSGVEDGGSYAKAEMPEISARLFNVTTSKDTDLASLPVRVILNGAEFTSFTVSEGKLTVDTSALQAGVYDLAVSFRVYGEDLWTTASFTVK